MLVLALVAEKGGSGKSTLAVHLAVAAAREGKSVAIIDLDPQASAAHWAERRADRSPYVAVTGASASELPGLLASAREQGADMAIIDTAGRSDVTTARVLEAAQRVLVPCRASVYDIESARHTAVLIAAAYGADAPSRASFVLNACPPRGTRAAEAREALSALLPVCPVELAQLVSFADALNDGRSVEELEPSGKAAQSIRTLYEWVTAKQPNTQTMKLANA